MKHTLRRTALSLALSAVLIGPAIAQQRVAPAEPDLDAISAAPETALVTRAGIFDPLLQQLDARAVGLPEADGGRYALVQFETIRSDAMKLLQRNGASVINYLPHRAYLVRLDSTSTGALSRIDGVRWAGPLPSLMRIDPALWPDRRATTLDAVEQQIEVFGHRGESADELARAVAKFAPGSRVVIAQNRELMPYVQVEVAAAERDALLDGLLRADAVAWVTPWLRPGLDNVDSVGPMQGNAISAVVGGEPTFAPIWQRGILGTGQIVAVADSGLDRNEDWFVNLDQGAGPLQFITPADEPVPPLIGLSYPDAKVYAYWVQPGATAYDNTTACPGGFPTSFHGTHVSGTVAGDRGTPSTPTDANYANGNGMAPNAQLMFQDIGNDTSGCLSITDFAATMAQAHAGGARLHNNSWGSDSFGAYGGNDIDVDSRSRQLRDLLIVTSAGNSGPGAGSTGTPGNAKNAVTVAWMAHGNGTSTSSGSSRGPTDDGRIKPDIGAPGSSIISARGNTNNTETVQSGTTGGLSGTSMASPTIAGAAALARQYFADGYYPRGEPDAADAYNISGVAMKAFLLNSTRALEEVSPGWPNNNTGWGRLWLDHGLYFNEDLGGGGSGDSRRLRVFERPDSAGLATGEQHEYVLNSVAAGEELRFTLTWFDVAGAAGAALTLVNDLDLEVVGPGGTYLGNRFTASESVTGGSRDLRNSVEQVRFSAPTAGSYTIRVKGAAVPGDGSEGSDRQGYGLIATGAFALPDAAPLAPPANITLLDNGIAGVEIGVDAVGGATGYQLYRYEGECADPEAIPEARMVAHGAGNTLIDLHTTGGYDYAYLVRAVGGDIEGDASACLDVTSAAPCELSPQFSVADVVVDANQGTCGVTLDWSAASSQCPLAADVTYTVEQASRPDFADVSVAASGLTTTEFTATDVQPEEAVFFRITATDSSGNSTVGEAVINATPEPVEGPSGDDFLDDVDNRSYARLEAPWQFTATSASDGEFSYHNAPDGANYASNTCASLTLPPLTIGEGGELSFVTRYDMEINWDGVVTQISTNGGVDWVDLPPDGGYPGSFADTQNPPVNACGFPASQGAFSGNQASFVPFTADLSAFEGETVQIRWVMSTDPAFEEGGFYLDEVRVTASEPLPPEVFADGFEEAPPPRPASVEGQCTVTP